MDEHKHGLDWPPVVTKFTPIFYIFVKIKVTTHTIIKLKIYKHGHKQTHK